MSIRQLCDHIQSNLTITQDKCQICTDPTFVTFGLVCVVPSPYELSGSPVVYGNARFHGSAKQLRDKHICISDKWISFKETSGTRRRQLTYSMRRRMVLKWNRLTCLLFTALAQLWADSLSRKRTNATPLLWRVSLSFTIVTLEYERHLLLTLKTCSNYHITTGTYSEHLTDCYVCLEFCLVYTLL